ncbi:hypothetical protein HHI_02480 [Hyphomonas hirschiana VP5]|uniref:Uncharacterized protein n=1 Tax=Hyphomonas hirschiana VP5 TaxID=1280951 RepID=A0A059G1H3_9PROT|nr:MULTISPECIES: hypothetical protein [Hyphomonas]KCZ96509.1 hypothetical protein HHI_02480 [Hyphomonas hirschiana VP5]
MIQTAIMIMPMGRMKPRASIAPPIPPRMTMGPITATTTCMLTGTVMAMTTAMPVIRMNTMPT